MSIFENILVVVGMGLAILLIWAVVGTYHVMKLDKKCLEAGYTGASVTYDYEGYCVKRDQYGATVVTKEKDIK